jgi:eukaryotic-like serine/threonine-protein kinase
MRISLSHLLRTVTASTAMMIGVLCSACGGLHVHGLLLHNAGDWPMAGRTASGLSSDTSQVIRPPLTVLWENDLSGGTGPGGAIAVDSVLLCGTLQGEIVGINLVNGKDLGSKKISVPISGSPVCIGNEVYFCTEAGKETVFDYNLRDGDYIWKKNIGGVFASPIAIRNRLVAGTLDGTLYALRASDGETLWKYSCGAPIFSTPCADDSLIYCSDTHGSVYALRADSGRLAWKQTLGGAVYGGLSVVHGTLFAGARDHRLYAMDAQTGKLRWTYDCEDRIMTSVSSDDSLVVVSALNGSVTALTHDGRVKWKFSAASAVNTPGVLVHGAYLLASLDTYLYALSLADGSLLWKYSIGARIKSAPIVWNGSLIVIGDNKTIYRFVSK